MFPFPFFVCPPKGGSWSQASPVATVETGDKYRNPMHSMYVFKRCRAFRTGLVHKFYCLKALFILEQVNTSMVENKEESFMSKTSAKLWWWGQLVGCCELSLYANESCDEQAVFLVVIEMRCHVHHIFALWISEYPEECLTVYKVGYEKPLARKFCFV